jgi:enolase-phosphatase E1
MKAILLDIEGTTTPIDFVHKTLFPYARLRMPAYVSSHFGELDQEIDLLRIEHEKDLGYTEDFDPHVAKSVAKYLVYLIDADRKSTPLKSIQGKIWKEGYESGELKSIVFDDVPPAFERWYSSGIVIAIYSSGSALAQKLLFRNTNQGDLTRFIADYFDTTTGAKQDSESYARISEDLDLEAGEIIFCSDVVNELDAARLAGFQTVLVLRKGNAEITEDVTYRTIESFDELE